MARKVGDRFQQETKYHRDRMPGRPLDRPSRPDTYEESVIYMTAVGAPTTMR